MALGKRKDGGDFLPIVKFDGRIGKFYLQDRVFVDGEWKTEQIDITEVFEAIFDLEKLERGWIKFPKGAAPEVILVPAGDDPGDAPGDDFKEGLRVVLRMAERLGGDKREMLSTARGLWNAIDALHDEYLAQVEQHRGQLPVVKVAYVKEKTNAAGVTYVPIFRIDHWVPRVMMDSTPAPETNSGSGAAIELDEQVPF